jgi:hypothetical protein
MAPFPRSKLGLSGVLIGIGNRRFEAPDNLFEYCANAFGVAAKIDRAVT